MNMSFVLRLPRKMHLYQMFHACHRFLEVLQSPHVLLTFGKGRLPRKTTSEPSKAV